MKTCSKCRSNKDLHEFYNDRKRKDGKTPQCKECMNSQQLSSGIRTSKKRREYSASYYEKNKEKILSRQKADRELNPEKYRARYMANAEKIKSQAMDYYRENKERVIAATNRRYHEKLKYDESFQAIRSARRLLHNTLAATGAKRTHSRTNKNLGYSPMDLKTHLESLFVDGMGWHNRSEWHIDHIVPISEFVRMGITCTKKINKLSNLRPVWAKENLSKGDRFALVSNNRI